MLAAPDSAIGALQTLTLAGDRATGK